MCPTDSVRMPKLDEENAHLVCHHAMLASVSLGLGTTIIGMIPPVVDRSKLLRERYGIPKENRVVSSLILGYPKHRYRQGIRRASLQFGSIQISKSRKADQHIGQSTDLKIWRRRSLSWAQRYLDRDGC